MVDRIFVDNLHLGCRIGVTDAERLNPQEVILDVSLFLDLEPGAASGSLDDTVNYKEYVERLSGFVSNGEFVLLEALAGGIAGLSLSYPGVEKVTIKARKSKYSKEPSIGIEMTREK